jgi:hypothetical protein
MRKCGKKILWIRTGHRLQYGVCALHARYLNLQTHIQNMYHLLIFHCNNSCTNASQCYVICTLPVSSFISGYKMSRPVCLNQVTGAEADEPLCNASQRPEPKVVQCNTHRCPAK